MSRKLVLTVAIIVLMALFCVCLVGCRQADTVTYNVQKNADYFNVARRIVVLNARTDTPLFELKGYFALSNNEVDELVITCEVGEGVYQVHYVYLNEYTLYVVEDLSGAKVDKYHYEIWYLPESIIPSIKPID